MRHTENAQIRIQEPQPNKQDHKTKNYRTNFDTDGIKGGKKARDFFTYALVFRFLLPFEFEAISVEHLTNIEGGRHPRRHFQENIMAKRCTLFAVFPAKTKTCNNEIGRRMNLFTCEKRSIKKNTTKNKRNKYTQYSKTMKID